MTYVDSTEHAAIFPAGKNGHAMTAIMRRTSPRIGHNPGGHPMMPCIPLALTSPAAPSAASIRDTGKAAGTRPGWADPGQDRSGLWLRNAAAGLCVLAAAAAAVSFTAQYRMVDATRHLPVIAALEAAIPDAAALVFACLGIALALHGRRALRARALNLASVAASVFMNAIAAEPGWRNLAIWAMPPVAYALASDTLIGVVRAWALARHQHLDAPLAADAATPLAILGGLLLWLLRLALAPASTLAGFRAWVLEECPVAPGRRAPRPAPPPAPRPPGRGRGRTRGRRPRPPGSWIWSPNGTGLSPRSRSTPRRRDQRRPGPPGRPEPRRRPHRPAQSRPGRPERRPPMMHQVRHRPGHRAHRGRVRRVGVPARPPPARQPRPPPADPPAPAAAPRQRLRPPSSACGCAGAAWPPCAAPASIRPSLPLRYRLLDPREHSVFLGRAHYRHGLRVPLEEHLLVMAPPRTYKTAFLADVILRYPGPVIATTTKADIYALTSAVRAQLGPVHVFNPQYIGGVPSTFRWSPVDGCQDPATAIRRADAFAFAVSQKGVEDGTFWSAKASDYLRGYFHAAALAG